MSLQTRNLRGQKVLRITLVADVSDNAFHVSAVDRSHDGLAGDFFSVPFTHNDSNPEDIELGEALSGYTMIRLTGTIQA